MKHIGLLFFCILFVFFSIPTYAQQNDTAVKKRDTMVQKRAVKLSKDTLRKPSKDTLRKPSKDTLKNAAKDTFKQKKPIRPPDTTIADIVRQPPTYLPPTAPQNSIADNDSTQQKDTVLQVFPSIKSGSSISEIFLKGNKFLNSTAQPQFFIIQEREPVGKEFLFYSICGLLLLLGVFKTFYRHYFSNLFRVYFNTSLRQTQLSEQLLQARLPSFLLNVFFVIVTGIFLWQLFVHFDKTNRFGTGMLLQFCIITVALVYLIKYCFLKFIGWVAGISELMDHYIFIIFMVNKLLGILLLPFIILLAFSNPDWLGTVKTFAFLGIGLLFLSRYAKSYGLKGQKISIKPFHFILFFIGAELIPLALLYKATIDYFIS